MQRTNKVTLLCGNLRGFLKHIFLVDVRFENAWRDFCVDFQEAEGASVSDVERVLRIWSQFYPHSWIS